jgi:hypothetical protein
MPGFATAENVFSNRKQSSGNTPFFKPLSGNDFFSPAVLNGAATPGTTASAAGTATQSNCLNSTSGIEKKTETELFSIVDVAPPCYACPNSDQFACPKLADKIFPPVFTGPVQFSRQVRFLTMYKDKGIAQKGPGNKKYVIQKIEKLINFSVPPPSAYTYTSPYWEAFEINADGETEIDYWQLGMPDLTAGDWEMKATLYLTEQLPAGMALGNVAEAGGIPSATAEPKGLGRIRGTRSITGKFDFTGTYKKHYY